MTNVSVGLGVDAEVTTGLGMGEGAYLLDHLPTQPRRQCQLYFILSSSPSTLLHTSFMKGQNVGGFPKNMPLF